MTDSTSPIPSTRLGPPGKPVQADSLTGYDGKVAGFCNPGCRDRFEAAIRHFEQAAERAAR